MLQVRVKICGITNTSDALQAVEAGADALGFMFFPGSTRHLGAAQAREIIQALPQSVSRVGVFVDPTVEEVERALASGIDTLQFHGEEAPEFCRRFGVAAMKAFRVRDRDSLASLSTYSGMTWLLDSFVPGVSGGTGTVFNWELAIEAKNHGQPIFLAGGLTPANVAEAVRRVRPSGVDVSSGVETSPGRKDSAKVRAFIRAAKEA